MHGISNRHLQYLLLIKREKQLPQKMRPAIHRPSTHKICQVMNMRGRKSRIQPVPMMSSEYPPRSIGFSEGQLKPLTMEPQLQSQPSQPIPIKKCRLSPQELEDEASADSASHYDWATWRMYTRITAARRLRPVSKRGCSQQKQQPIIMTQDYHANTTREHAHLPAESGMSHIDLQPSTVEEDFNDGVFFFDDM